MSIVVNEKPLPREKRPMPPLDSNAAIGRSTILRACRVGPDSAATALTTTAFDDGATAWVDACRIDEIFELRAKS